MQVLQLRSEPGVDNSLHEEILSLFVNTDLEFKKEALHICNIIQFYVSVAYSSLSR